MGLIQFKAQFGDDFAQKLIARQKERIELIFIDQLEQVAEEFVIDARDIRTYQDRTGNLRGSIGYTIFKDGEAIRGNYDDAGKYKKDQDLKEGKDPLPYVGPEQARQIAISIGENILEGFALVLVAGMNYAAAVESKNYDVITGSSFTAEENLKAAMSRLQTRLKQLSAKR